jgi:ligand-binding sensor domain-containing protein
MKFKRILYALSFSLCISSCNGQVRKDLPKEKEKELPKLMKITGNGNVQCSLQDKAGNLWFGTSDEGLYKYDGQSFRQFLVADGLSNNEVSSILEDREGNIWISTKAGLCFYDGKKITNRQIPLPKNLPPNKNTYYRDSHWVFSIIQAKDGKLWFATIDGVYTYDGKSFTPFVIAELSGGYLSSNNNVERILEDKEGNIWFGGRTNAGVFRYDGKSITHFKLQEITIRNESARFEKDSIIRHNWAWPQIQDKNGNIWFSNWCGAYRYDGKTFTVFTKSDGLAGSQGLVAKIIEDKNGNLWFGGADGICRYDEKSFTCFNAGLINPWIWTVLEDKTGNLWVGTRQTGLYLFDGKTFIDYTARKY